MVRGNSICPVVLGILSERERVRRRERLNKITFAILLRATTQFASIKITVEQGQGNAIDKLSTMRAEGRKTSEDTKESLLEERQEAKGERGSARDARNKKIAEGEGCE